MGFEALKEKVRQAEAALEAKERQATADYRQVKSSWRQMWTPGRIVIAGLIAGFVVGKLEPAKRVARSGGLVQLITAISGLFAGTSAQAAAGKAEDVAQSAQQTAAAVDPNGVAAAAAAAQSPPVDA